jgi:hypothetical protein
MVLKKVFHAVLGLASFAGILSSKSALAEVISGNANDISNHEIFTINSADASVIKNLLNYYWGKPTELSESDIAQIQNKFGEIPSEDHLGIIMANAIANLSISRGTELDNNGEHEFKP